MPRRPRIEFPGAIYHVMARGNQRSEIFLDDEDREHFLDTFDEVCQSHGWEVYAWVMMTNHYHFAFRTPEANLVDGMKWFQNAYTRRFNTRHRGWGRLFGDRYKSELVQTRESWKDAMAYCPAIDRGPPPRNETARYLKTLIDYVHLNPARARMVDVMAKNKEEVSASLAGYRWSSLAQGYLVTPSKRPSWLAASSGFRHIGHSDTPAGRSDYLARLQRQMVKEQDEGIGDTGALEQSDHEWELSHTEERARSWLWGSDDFANLVREGFFDEDDRLKNPAAYQSSDLGREMGRDRAERLLAEARAFFGVADLRALPRNDLRRRAIAWSVWTQASGIRQAWLAEQLGVKVTSTLSAQIMRFRRIADEELPSEILEWKTKSISH